VTEEDRALIRTWFQQVVAEARESGNERRIESAERTRENLQFRETKTFWGSVLPTDTGHLWLTKPPREMPEPTGNAVLEYRVVDPQGRYLGDTSMPPMQLPSARLVGAHLLALVIDPDTIEPIPTVFRIRPAAAGLAYP
jgi:hypothetical protein